MHAFELLGHMVRRRTVELLAGGRAIVRGQ